MEKPGYRESYEHLLSMFPGRVAISVQETADVMGVSIKTVYAATRRVKNPLPCKHIGSARIVIPIAALARWMA